MKLLELFSLLPHRSGEFADRTSAVVNTRLEFLSGRRPEYQAMDINEGAGRLAIVLGPELLNALSDEALIKIGSRVHFREADLPSDAPFGRFHNGDSQLGQLCYIVARAIHPKITVETGVCYGVTTSYVLQALEVNGQGHLHSIDLPPLGKNGDDYVGWLIPSELRRRWTLRRGTSRRLLGPLLKELKSINLFVHDSLHTYKNMMMEFELVWRHLSPGGVIIADDIQGNMAFQEFCERRDVAFHAVIQESAKASLAGILIKAA